MKNNWRWLVSATVLITLPIFWMAKLAPGINVLMAMLYPGTWTGGEVGEFNTWPLTIFGWIITIALIGVGIVPHVRAARERKQNIPPHEK